MGATNIDFELDGKLNKSEVMNAISRQRESDESENGHQSGYSGDWQTIQNVTFPSVTFDTYKEAYDYVSEKCEKWEGMAVKYKECPKEKLNSVARQKAEKKVKDIYASLGELEKNEKQAALEGTSVYMKCANCKSKLSRSHQKSVHCPVCNHLMLSAAAVKRIEKMKSKLEEAKKKLADMDKELTIKHGKERWLVYGLAAC